jgi:caffeoyl-CoA O-methyltransferase
MEIINAKVQDYITQHTSAEDEILSQLNRATFLKMLLPNMISGHEQGVFLEMLSRLKQPESILEIGTFTGYSAICLAKGLLPNGKLITIEIDEEKADLIEEYVQLSGMNGKIELKIGKAENIIPLFNEKFDIVYIDADKQNYLKYYKLIFDKVKKNGLIIVDNVLWRGSVIETSKTKDTHAIQTFNDYIQQDKNVINTIIPIRDGIMLIIKL